MEEGNSGSPDCVSRALPALRRADRRGDSNYLTLAPQIQTLEGQLSQRVTTSLAWQTLFGLSMDEGYTFPGLFGPGRPVVVGKMNVSQGRGATSSTAWLHRALLALGKLAIDDRAQRPWPGRTLR